MKKRVFSKKHRDAISRALRGKQKSKKHRKKISESLKGHISPNKGKKMTDEQKKKLSIAHMGKKLSRSTKKKISIQSTKNNIISWKNPITRAKRIEGIRKKAIGRIPSEKTRKLWSRQRSGKKNPNYKHGNGYAPYPIQFYKKRKNILIRDENTCQICLKKFINERKLNDVNFITVHHIDYNKNNNKNSNLITLCNRCNGKCNSNRKLWKKYFKEIL